MICPTPGSKTTARSSHARNALKQSQLLFGSDKQWSRAWSALIKATCRKVPKCFKKIYILASIIVHTQRQTTAGTNSRQMMVHPQDECPALISPVAVTRSSATSDSGRTSPRATKAQNLIQGQRAFRFIVVCRGVSVGLDPGIRRKMLFFSRYRLRSDTLSPVETTNSFSSFARCTVRTGLGFPAFSSPQKDALDTVCVRFIRQFAVLDVHLFTSRRRYLSHWGETTVHLCRRGTLYAHEHLRNSAMTTRGRGGIPHSYAFTFSKYLLLLSPTGARLSASRCLPRCA